MKKSTISSVSLLLAVEEVNEDELDLFLLSGLFKPRIYHPLDKIVYDFNFENFTDSFCFVNFRFGKTDLLRLCHVLKFPDKIKADNGISFSGLEALCIVLRRLAYPNRLSDLMHIFPHTPCEISRIFNVGISFIKTQHGNLLSNVNNNLFSQGQLESYAEVIRSKGSPYSRCIGFLDGTVRAICRPTNNQREYYNGHKRIHALKFQSLMLPNGIIGNLFGPVPGRRHDSFMLNESGLIEKLENHPQFNLGNYYLYADPGYPLLPTLIVPFRGTQLTQAQQQVNASMSSVRESVEWGFAKIINNFAFLDYKKNLKIGFSPIADYYTVGVILTNCHGCLYGSEVSTFFGCTPPKLEDYVN